MRLIEYIFYIIVMLNGVWWLVAKLNGPVWFTILAKLSAVFIIVYSILKIMGVPF